MEPITTITHDGGLFSFSVPSHWEHEIEEDGNQVFWDNQAGSGTLRVTSLTMRKSVNAESTPQVEILAKRGHPTSREDGVAWISYRRETEENQQKTIMFWWELASFIPPCYLRLALFSFTIYAEEELQPETQAQLNSLHNFLPQTKFGQLQQFEQ